VELFHKKTDLVGVQILLSFPVVSQVSVGRHLFECDCTGGGGLEDRLRVACVFLNCKSVECFEISKETTDSFNASISCTNVGLELRVMAFV
jgi:hypothetical protein